MIKIDVKIDDSKLRRVASAIGLAIRRAVEYTGQEVQNTIVLNLQGRILRVRSGTLVNEWMAAKRHIETLDSNRVRLTFGPGSVPYAAIHEYGGTITPKNAKALTIPTDEMLARGPRSGAGKVSASKLISDPVQFGFGGTFFRNGILYGWVPRKRGAGRVIPLFILKKSVRMPARRYVTKSMQQVEGKVRGIVDDAIRDAVREVNQ